MYNPLYFLTTTPNIDENDDLREPQKIAYSKAYDHIVRDKKTTHGIIILPTGVGKTGLMGLLPYGISNGRVLIITPQLVIKDSVIGSLDPDFPGNFWLDKKVFSKIDELPVLIEYEGKETKQEWLDEANIVIVNVQKLQSRLISSLINRVPSDFFDLIIIDEAHHSTASTWVETLEYFSNAKVIKLTGTPFRSDGEKIVGEIIYEYSLSAAMAHQYVKSLENFTYIPDQLYLTLDNDKSIQYTVQEILDMGLKDQDWISRTVAYSDECSEKVVIESINKLEQKLSSDNPIPHKIIAVACSIKHAEQISELYRKHGYECAIIHSDLDQTAKQQVLSDIENHRVKVVINVAMLGEGYDHPYLSVAAIFRPFRSLLPYAQFIGRVLRAIPSSYDPKAIDNIAEIVCHQDLNLDSLWQYYKQEIQESETIKYLAHLDLDEGSDEENTEKTTRNAYDTSVGNAVERGQGSLIGDPYLDTQLIAQRKKEEEEELRNIQEIQRMLGITAEQARILIQQSKGLSSSIKRPDLYIKRRRKGIDARIREDIVPTLLNKFKIDKESDNLKNCRIFKGTKYFWIAQKYDNNAAMLAIYMNTWLKQSMGMKRDDWGPSDWDVAEKKLDQINEFLIKVLEDFTEKM